MFGLIHLCTLLKKGQLLVDVTFFATVDEGAGVERNLDLSILLILHGVCESIAAKSSRAKPDFL